MQRRRGAKSALPITSCWRKPENCFPPVASGGGCSSGYEIDGAVGELSESGADVVFGMDSEKLALFHVDYHTEAVMQAVKAFDPDILLAPASGAGEELAPTLGFG